MILKFFVRVDIMSAYPRAVTIIPNQCLRKKLPVIRIVLPFIIDPETFLAEGECNDAAFFHPGAMWKAAVMMLSKEQQ